MSNNGVSVIICCYNSAGRIVQTLEHLKKQQTGVPWELVVVDNACTDDTVKIAKRYWEQSNLSISLRIVLQPIAGLGNARSKGIELSSFEYIIFCDDDNWLKSDYIETSYHLLANNLTIGIAGGHSQAVTDDEFPDWFEKKKGSYACGSKFSGSQDVTDITCLWGSGMITRKSLMVKVFDNTAPMLCSDRTGAGLESGGDDEICMRVMLMGYRLFFCKELFFKHYISRHRLTAEYLDKLLSGFKTPQKIIGKYTIMRRLAKCSWVSKASLFIYNLFKYTASKIASNKTGLYYSRIYLYFMSDWKYLEDNEIRIIKLYYNLACKSQLKNHD